MLKIKQINYYNLLFHFEVGCGPTEQLSNRAWWPSFGACGCDGNRWWHENDGPDECAFLGTGTGRKRRRLNWKGCCPKYLLTRKRILCHIVCSSIICRHPISKRAAHLNPWSTCSVVLKTRTFVSLFEYTGTSSEWRTIGRTISICALRLANGVVFCRAGLVRLEIAAIGPFDQRRSVSFGFRS